MGRLLALASLLAGCGFHGPPLVADDMPGDGPAECTAGFLDLCAQAAPTTPLDLTISETINTDLDLRCRPQGQVGGGDVCLLYATSVMIHGGVTLSATGTRPLAIASTSTFALEGAIDVSSHAGLRGAAADAAACNFAAMPASDTGGRSEERRVGKECRSRWA